MNNKFFINLDYLRHVFFKIFKNPRLLLDYRNYIIKFRFHLWPILNKSNKNKISLFNTIFHIETDTFNGRGIYSKRNLHEKNERDLIKKEIKANSICIDIGSNVGFYSVFLLKNKIAKKVYSFEINKKTFQILLKNTENLNCVQILGPVGDKKNQINVDEKIEKNEKIDFIKIDLDGEDFFALKSCERIIKDYKPKILIEISESSERNQGIRFSDVIKYLKNLGYKCYFANENLIEFDKVSLKKDEVLNIFCK